MEIGQACPMPATPDQGEEAVIRRMLAGKRIAVVGLSDDPSRPSYYVSKHMKDNGYEIVGVNPNCASAFGVKCYPSLAEVPGKVDVVNVFRRPLACAEVTRQAIAIGAKGVWLQAGIRNEQAAKLAKEAGIDFIEDHCIMVEHMRHARR
jgi:predicted CoA-binding protein